MKTCRTTATFSGLLAAFSMLAAISHAAEADSPIRWKKTVIEAKFRSEGVAVADVNRNGQQDILVGDVWYEAPDWKVHEIRPPGDYGDGASGYSQCFACWADDINGNGWPDLVVVGFPGAPCHWYENPQGEAGHWKQHVICDSACNETPQYVDLFGTGRRALVIGYHEQQMVWVAPGEDPTQPWGVHPISQPGQKAPGTERYAHGLGVGDVNGDGRLDVICTGGWWEQPAEVDEQTPWTFHPARIGDACADMHVYDVNGNGKADIISSSAHAYGIWAHLQQGEPGASPSFVKLDLFPKLFSQSHALHCVDIDGDGLKDLVTGKRWWAHGPSGDPDPNLPPVLYWFQARRNADGAVEFIPHEIDDASGIGTQFWVGDFSGNQRPDIVTSNKRGVFLFQQVQDE